MSNRFRIYCKKCRFTTSHDHKHDTAYGRSGTHMVGTERYVCRMCGNAIFEAEGQKMGLEYKFDGDYTRTKNKTTEVRTVHAEDGTKLIINPPNKLKISEIFAFISTDADDNEDIVGYIENGLALPLIGADMERIDSLRKRAQWIADHNPKYKIRLVKFTARENLEMIEASKI